MHKGFWAKLDKPFFCLAPLADVTDAAFRRVIAEESRISERNDVVMWTEFVSADGLFRGGYEKLSKDLIFSEVERPIVAQFFSPNTDEMIKAAELASELGFDGVDINMGCPAQNVCKQGSGAALIKDPKRAREIIKATKVGAGELPVSVKTRIGYNENEIETWLPELLAEEPAAVTLHARTRKEMSKVPAHWEVIKRAVEIRDNLGSKTYIVGNGDVVDLSEARKKAKETGADGIMLGRAIFGNPWLFREGLKPEDVPVEEKLSVLVRHTHLFEELLGGYKNFALMKKHFSSYVSGFNGAKELRIELMDADNSQEVDKVTKSFLNSR
jgi:nifR3 family TIM-barrel protein